MQASIKAANEPWTQDEFLQEFPVQYLISSKPFPLVRFSSDNANEIARLAVWLDYRGPLFNHEPFDMLDTTGQFGFDLVKTNAHKFLETWLKPSYA